ncbi:6248_t:CDS:2 [Paraglomus occultum]|uniref:6248_t:CDS:1 n=1 Tax=Paraglomus occultum TaxID=144539 RepID=A0A9N8W7G7_9GLOM|nr:6248_t:CDS:2 [Paraglomus occultum]
MTPWLSCKGITAGCLCPLCLVQFLPILNRFGLSVIPEKIDISVSLRKAFDTPLQILPTATSLKDLATAPFDKKIPIESVCYKKWKSMIGDTVDNYFINGDANGTSGSSLSYKCQSALEQDYSGSENVLLSRYDRLVRDIWCELSKNLPFSFLMDRNVMDYSGATVKNTRPDVMAWLNGALIFKAEEKQFAADKAVAEQELLAKMDFWNRSTYGRVPYILSYAAAANLVQFFAITRDMNRIDVSDVYDLQRFPGEFMTLVSSLNLFRVIVTFKNYLPERYAMPMYQEVRRKNNTVVTLLSDTTVLKEIRNFDEYIDFDTLKEVYESINGSAFCVYSIEGPKLGNKKKRKISETGTHYSVVLTPVCHHRQPKNEDELRIAITAVLKGLNQLHSRGVLIICYLCDSCPMF